MNFKKAIVWFWWSILAVFFGAMIAAMLGSLIEEQQTAAFAVHIALIGGFFAGIVPVLIMVWFLLLHMVGQLSGAIRDNQKD